MTTLLRALLIEDSVDDAELVIREIQLGGYEVEFERVETMDAMRSALADRAWDIIICDYTLPQFNGLQALKILHESGLDLPFVIVSGSIGEETAVTALKAGAHDFIIKGHYARLPHVLQKELQDADIRRKRKQTEEALRRSEERFRHYFELGLIGMAITSADRNTLEVNEKLCLMLGYGRDELMGMHWDTLTHPDDLSMEIDQFVRILSGESNGYSLEKRFVRKGGGVIHAAISVTCARHEDGKVDYFISLLQDITERKRSEEILKRRETELQQRNVELERLYRASEALLTRTLVDMPELAHTIVQTVLREFQKSNCSLLILNSETGELERAAVEGPYAEDVSKASLRLEKPGLVAKSIRLGEVINVPDVSIEPDYMPNWKLARSELVIPLRIAGEVIGALDVQSPNPDAFDKDDERLMTIFADRAALALERTRLYQQTIRQLERFAALRIIDLAISNSLDLRLTLNTVLEQVIRQLGVDAADILLFKPEISKLEYAVGKGFYSRNIELSSLRPGEGYAGIAAFERRIVHFDDLKAVEEKFTRYKLLEAENFISYYGVPLVAKGEVKGVLEIFHRSRLKTDMEWLNFLDSLGWQTAIAIDNALLFERIQRSNFELALAYDATIEGWSHALDLRDKETEGHTLRVTEMTLRLARVMRVPGEEIVHVRRGALLHDIGKMGIPDSILLKPDKLTDDEWVVMRKHPQYAYDMLVSISYLRPALDIPYCHHEKWDGTGYPRGLAGLQIPLVARLFAVVDVWDAITSDRPYRKKWTKRQALKFIRDQAGSHFDPSVVEAFMREIVNPIGKS